MKSMVEKTGGLIVLHDTFIHMVFAESFNRVFTRDAAHNELTMGFAAEISVATSRYALADRPTNLMHRSVLIRF
jgi:protein transport protein SEC23